MRIKLRKTALLIAAIFATAELPHALAQVTVNLTTTQQTSCIATTDVNGLTSVPGTTELQATGVTLSGSGCGSSGSGGSNFGTTVAAPASATAGVPFVVTWTASSNATLCTFAGTSGAAGWPVGATACSGSECAGSHPRAVTVANGGASTFAMTCTNTSGFGTAGTTISGSSGPPTPPNFALTVPQNVTVNVPFQVSWSVQNATSCVGTASLGGSSVTLPGWTTGAGSTSPNSPRTVTATQPGNYTLQLTCSNSFGSVSSAPATISASSGGGASCPAGLQSSLTISTSPSITNIITVDATQFINIWGRVSTAPGTELTPFPGDNVAIYWKDLDKTKYVAAKFVVPTDGAIPNGTMAQTSTTPGPKLSMKLSQTCGDFNPDGSLCVFESQGPGGRLALWRTPNGSGNACVLTPGATYYANLKVTNPGDSNTFCTGNICKGGVGNTRTPQ